MSALGARAEGMRFLYSPSTRRVYSSRISSAILTLDSFTSSANGACGRHERHDNAGMRLLTAASGWRSSVRRSKSPVQRQAGRRAHRDQCREAAPIVGENSIGICRPWRLFHARIDRSASSSTCVSVARLPAPRYTMMMPTRR